MSPFCYLFRPVHTLAVNSEPYLTILCTDIRGKARTIQSPAIFLYSIPNFFIKSEFVGLIVTYTVFDLSNFVTLGKFVLHSTVVMAYRNRKLITGGIWKLEVTI